MHDVFADHSVGLTAPAIKPETITPNDSSELALVTRALYVGQSGAVRLMTASGDIVTFVGMQGGALYPLRVRQVFATGTTATDLIGLS